MRWNTDLGQQPKDINKLTFSKLKTIVKKQLQSKMNDTTKLKPTNFIVRTKLKPTNFIVRTKHQYPDESVEALLLLGLWKGGFKTWALRQIAKEKDAIVGEVYVEGKDREGKTILVFNIQKGKGKSEVEKLKKTLHLLTQK